MDCIELFKKAAAAMQTDPRYLELDALKARDHVPIYSKRLISGDRHPLRRTRNSVLPLDSGGKTIWIRNFRG